MKNYIKALIKKVTSDAFIQKHSKFNYKIALNGFVVIYGTWLTMQCVEILIAGDIEYHASDVFVPWLIAFLWFLVAVDSGITRK